MPPLQEQLVPLIFTGLDTKVDPRTAPLGKLGLVENAYQLRTGEWRVRDGLDRTGTAIFGGGSISEGKSLDVYGDELLIGNSNGLYSYDYGVTQWVNKGTAARVAVTTEPVGWHNTDVCTPDVAVSGTLACFVYVAQHAGGSGQVRYTMVDTTSGDRIAYDVLIQTGCSRPKVVAVGSTFFVFYYNPGGTPGIRCVTIAAATPTTVSSESSIVSASAAPGYDVVADASGGAMLLAYYDATSGFAKCVRVTTGLVVGAANTLNNTSGVVAVGWLAWDQSNGSAYVALAGTGNGVRVSTVTVSTGAQSATEIIDSGVLDVRNVTGYYNGTTKNVYYERPGASSTLNLIRYNTVGGTASDFKRGVGLAGKTFKSGSTYYTLLAYGGSAQPTYFLVDQNRNIVAKHLFELGGGTSTISGFISSAATLSSTVFLYGTLQQTRAAQTGETATRLGANMLRVDLGGAGFSRGVQIGRMLYRPGGIVTAYDGTAPTEAGFHLYPEAPTLTSGGGGAGAMTASGVYYYRLVWEWVDAKSGAVHQSAPSLPVTVTLGGAHTSCRLTIPTLRLTDKATEIRVKVYRTQNGGQTYNLVNTFASNLRNSTTTDTLTYDDTSGDSGIAARESLYTDERRLDNLAPPAAKLLEVFQGHLVAAGCEYSNEVWISMPHEEGVGIAFNTRLRLILDDDDGEITALGVLDDKLVIFKANSAYVLVGAGPNALGQGMYELPTRLAISVGTTEPKSVVRTPQGLMFKSSKGIYLLTRGLEAVYVGAPVETYNTLTVTAASTVDSLNQVRFVTSEGRCLVYDWFQSQVRGEPIWYTFTNYAAVSCVNWNGVFTTMTSGGVLRSDRSGTYNDDATTEIVPRWETTWISLAPNQRLWGVEIFGQWVAGHTLRAQYAFDFDDATTDTARSVAVSASGIYRLELRPSRQRNRAFKVILYANGTTAPGTDSLRLSGMTASLGVEGAGWKPLGSTKRMS